MSVTRRTAQLARQFHSAGVIVQPAGQQAERVIRTIDEDTFGSGIADVYAGQTFTPPEVGDLLKCSVKTVHRIFQHMPGIVPVGKHSYLIPRSLFDSWMRLRMSRIA